MNAKCFNLRSATDRLILADWLEENERLDEAKLIRADQSYFYLNDRGRVEEFVKIEVDDEERWLRLDDASRYMDEDAREAAHNRVAPCTAQEFWKEYVEECAHLDGHIENLLDCVRLYQIDEVEDEE